MAVETSGSKMENFPPNFVGDFLRLHNQYRAVHKAPPLQIEDKLNEYAQEWAGILAMKGVLEYRSPTEYGENVYVSFWRDVPYQMRAQDPLELWYRSGRYFKYGEEEPKSVEHARHFTQLVWRSTKSMGFGMASGLDGKIYFVCNYNPAGNVRGEFARNVLPPEQDGRELLQHEAEGIRTIEIRPEVVKSMERLYAVPSEKLRVWSVWLSKIGEIADEWQRWLRAHIDLSTRLSERLREVDLAVGRSKEPVADKSAEVFQEEQLSTEDRVDSTSDEETAKTNGISIQDATASRSEAFDDATGDQAESTEKPEEDGALDDDRSDSQGESETVLTAEATLTLEWPIGKPWQPIGREVVKEKSYEKLPLPRNEQEMREFLKQFTHQATVYRSYYKHWRETADQAIKDMGGRSVMASYVVQGKSDQLPKEKIEQIDRSSQESIKKNDEVPEEKTENAQQPKDRTESDSSDYYSALDVLEPSSTETGNPAVTEPSENPQITEPAENPQITEPAENPQVTQSLKNPTTEPPKQGTIVTNKNNKSPTSAASKSRAHTAPLKSTGSSKAKQRRMPFKSGRRFSKMQSCEETVESFRDKARAAEPIPYFFYLKTEPDVDIATEYDDEEIIETDPERESIVGNYKKIYFNLSDKP